MFEDALMESSHVIKTRSSYWSVPALAINCSLLAALIIWPLLHPDALPVQIMAKLLIAPSPPPPPQAPRPRMSIQPEMPGGEPLALSKTHNVIKTVTESDAVPSLDLPAMESTNGGIASDALNGIIEGIRAGHTSVVRVLPSHAIQVSSGVMAGNLLVKVTPRYPAIARAEHIQGTVVLQATISKAGTIQDIRVMSGPIMLQQAAVDAVRSWRYKPYLLNGEPVKVETTVNVVFNFGGVL